MLLREPKASSSVSQNMKILKNKSRLKSREFIAQKFRNPSDLADLVSIRSNLEKQLQEEDNLLKTIVQSKVDALKKSVDLMEESSSKMSEFSGIMTDVGKMLANANTEISHYPYLKCVYNIKSNIHKVLFQVEFFAAVPQKVSELRLRLFPDKNRHEADPNQLREVFMESIQLDSLRRALVREIDANDSLRDDVAQFLQKVPELVEEIAKCLLGFIDGERDFIDLAVLSPADLVAVLEVVEMHQEYYDRHLVYENGRSPSPPPKDWSRLAAALSSSLEMYNLKPRVKNAILAAMKRRIATCFDTISEQATETKISKVTALTDAGSELIRLFVDIINEADPCFPPSYEVVVTYFREIQAELGARFEVVCAEVEQYSVADILNLIDWLRYFLEQMERFHLRNDPFCDRFASLEEDLLLPEYLRRVKEQVMKLFDNIEQQSAEVFEGADGRQMTSAPEDMLNVAHIQISLARDGLPQSRLKDAVGACLSSLQEAQQKTTEVLSKRWIQLDPLRLSAAINDNRRKQEKCIELITSILPAFPTDQVSEKEQIATLARSIADEYLAISMKACGYLVRWILMQELREPVFSKLFTPEWEAGGSDFEELASVLVATSEDYMSDIKRWLTPMFLPHFLRQLAMGLSAHYIMSLRGVYAAHLRARAEHPAITPLSFGNSFRVAEILLIDFQILERFLDKQEAELTTRASISNAQSVVTEISEIEGSVGIGPSNNPRRKSSVSSSNSLSTELLSIQHVAKIATASHLSSVIANVKALFEKYGLDGLRLVQCIVSCGTTFADSTVQQEMHDAALRLYSSYSSLMSRREYSEEFTYLNDSSPELLVAVGMTVATPYGDRSPYLTTGTKRASTVGWMTKKTHSS